MHICETKVGSSGSPILNYKSYKVLGIHKGAHPKFDYNLGVFIKGSIEAFNLKYKEKKEEIDERTIINKGKTMDKIPPKMNLNQIEIIMNQMKKSVCKIFKGNHRANGFFCKIPLSKEKKNIPVLITNDHFLNYYDISPGNTINFSMNDDNHFFLVKTDNSRKIFSNLHLDYSMIEIKPKDKLDFISFFEIDESFLPKNSDFDENL